MRARVAALAGETFRSLHQHNYRLWFLGQGISQVGYYAQMVALAFLVLELSDSSLVLGIVMSLNFIPGVVLGAWAGVLSDRLDKRKLLLASQSTMLVCALCLGWSVLAGWIDLVWVVVLTSLSGIAFAIDQPARRTIVTELVQDNDLANAVSLNGSLNQGAKIFGPALAGVLLNGIGIGWCFVANGISSIAVLVALVFMDVTAIRRIEPLRRTRGQISEGFRYVCSDRAARLVLVMITAVIVLGHNWNVLLPLFATRDLGGTSATLAVLMGSMSVGALLGGLWLARRTEVGVRLLAHSCIAFGFTSVALALAPSVAVATGAAFVVGAASMVLVNGGAVALQLNAVPKMRGRLMAIFSMILLGGHAIGSVLSGWIAELAGARTALLVGAMASLMAGVAVAAAAAAAQPRGRVMGGHLSSAATHVLRPR